MNLKFTFWLFFVLFFASSCKESVQKESISVQQIADSATSVFEKRLFTVKADSLFKQTNFNGLVSIARNGKVFYEKSQGFEDFNTKKPLRGSSMFAVASISKQFTAALILRLVEQKLLNVDHKAAEYLPELNKNFAEVTINQLLTHTSGLNDFGETPLYTPGEKYSYSNKGYYYLGKITEKVSGKPLKVLYRELFKDAGMRNSLTADHFQDENFASAYLLQNKGFVEVEDMPKRLVNNTIGIAAGGILSTAADLHKWNYALHTGKILSPESLNKMRSKHSSSGHYILGKIGYGYGIMLSEQSPKAYFHSGYVKGSPALLVFYPDSKTSLVILSNVADERLNKKTIFQMHQEIKQLADWFELAKQKS